MALTSGAGVDVCRLFLRKRTPFCGEKGDKVSALERTPSGSPTASHFTHSGGAGVRVHRSFCLSVFDCSSIRTGVVSRIV